MFGDDDRGPDWTTIGLIAVLFYLGSKTVGAVKTISREVKRFNNFGLTTDEDEAARKVIADPKASTPDKLKAIETLRTKVTQAKAAGYADQVKSLDNALNALEKALRGDDELEAKRREWLKRQQEQKAGA